jgi:hypothetical protein
MAKKKTLRATPPAEMEDAATVVEPFRGGAPPVALGQGKKKAKRRPRAKRGGSPTTAFQGKGFRDY